MPIEPPNPLKILEDLRAVLVQLQALADANPRDGRAPQAMAGVETAIRALESPGTENQTPAR